MAADFYFDQVKVIESGLGPHAFRSENLTTFADQTDLVKRFEDEWARPEGKARLEGRTPLVVERDRILYSDEFKAQAERHHMMFAAGARTMRDYSGHILRMSQVARSICSRLRLNQDLAEAISLGAKVGGVPFIHVGKSAVDKWVKDKIKELDTSSPMLGDRTHPPQDAILDKSGKELPTPTWVDDIEDPSIREDVKKYMPWAAGATTGAAYSSGQQSYWFLSLEPFRVVPKSPYTPQALYGIWNHSLSAVRDTSRFLHELQFRGGGTLRLDESHLTHEAIVVRYADDICWVIENIAEAAKAEMLAGEQPSRILSSLVRELQGGEIPGSLHTALVPTADTGRVYTYFISDLVATSAKALEGSSSTATNLAPSLLETQPLIQLSETAARMLRLMKNFLENNVFSTERLVYRNRTLRAITETVLDVFWETRGRALTDYVEGIARAGGWSKEQREMCIDLLGKPVHRIQASVDALAGMTDAQVYRLLGLEAS